MKDKQYIIAQDGFSMNNETRCEIMKHLALAGYTVRLAKIKDGGRQKVAIEYWMIEKEKENER